RGLRGGFRGLDDLMTPLAPEQREPHSGFEAVVRIDEDRVPRSDETRLLDGGVARRAVDVVRRVRRERGDDQHDVPEGLREGARPRIRDPAGPADLRAEGG